MTEQEIAQRLENPHKFWDGVPNPNEKYEEILENDEYGPLVPPPPHEPIDHPEEIIQKWYKEYLRIGGKHDLKTFKKNQQKFEELTFDAYVIGLTLYKNREQAWKEWEEYIKDPTEANKYYDAIDTITPYC